MEKTAIQISKEMPNKDLLYISYESIIPEMKRNLKFNVYIDSTGRISHESQPPSIPDPSTIYVRLPISEDYYTDPLPYWPSYIEMTPGQRFKYLCWLRDVTQEVDIGYVFIYYYGLERQMLTGNFDKAFDEIVKLRNVHKNKSFQRYSENALVNAAILRGRLDKLMDLDRKTEISKYSNVLFYAAYSMKIPLGSQQIALICNTMFGTAKKALKENRDMLLECIETILQSKYGTTTFDISSYDISKTKNTKETRFANYSFSEELQHVKIVDFYQCKKLMEGIEGIYNASYELYKQKKALQRSNKTPEEIAETQRKKAENRYKKLLKEKMITQIEYDLLIKNM